MSAANIAKGVFILVCQCACWHPLAWASADNRKTNLLRQADQELTSPSLSKPEGHPRPLAASRTATVTAVVPAQLETVTKTGWNLGLFVQNMQPRGRTDMRILENFNLENLRSTTLVGVEVEWGEVAVPHRWSWAFRAGGSYLEPTILTASGSRIPDHVFRLFLFESVVRSSWTLPAYRRWSWGVQAGIGYVTHIQSSSVTYASYSSGAPYLEYGADLGWQLSPSWATRLTWLQRRNRTDDDALTRPPQGTWLLSLVHTSATVTP